VSNFVVRAGLVSVGDQRDDQRWTEGKSVQLRARDGRAVLAEDDIEFGVADGNEVDPEEIALDADLARSLHEWAAVAAAVANTHNVDGAAGGLISRRGRQLAGRLAAAMGVTVSYLDPLTGEISEIGEPDDWPPAHGVRSGGAHAAPVNYEPGAGRRARTPWGTGLTVSAFTALIALFAVMALSSALGAASDWLAVAANAIIALGLAPSIWLARKVPVWRWVAYGVVAGIGMAWIALLCTLA
jgi:hypothetical protein